jgi:hypothetical protein
MKIKLRGRNEIKAFAVIAKLLIMRTEERLSLEESGESVYLICRRRSADRPAAQILSIMMREGIRERKKITVRLDEMQTVLLWDELSTLGLAPYESQLALRVPGEIDRECQQFYRSRSFFFMKSEYLQRRILRVGERTEELSRQGVSMERIYRVYIRKEFDIGRSTFFAYLRRYKSMKMKIENEKTIVS